MRKKRISTSIRFPDPMLDELREAAEARDVSINWLVTKAVEDFLDRLLPADEIKLVRDRDEDR